MPLYLTRFSYTPETWARLLDNPEDRRQAAQTYIESVGGLSLVGIGVTALGVALVVAPPRER